MLRLPRESTPLLAAFTPSCFSTHQRHSSVKGRTACRCASPSRKSARAILRSALIRSLALVARQTGSWRAHDHRKPVSKGSSTMTPHHRYVSGPPHGPCSRCARLIPPERKRQRLDEDTRRAAHGSQPGRLFFCLPVETSSADNGSRTISAQHKAGQPTYVLVSAGTDSVMFRVVPCVSTRVKTFGEIRVHFRTPPRIARRARGCLWQQMEARHA